MAYGIPVGRKKFDAPLDLEKCSATYKLLQTFARFKLFRNVQSHPYKSNIEIIIWKGIYD